MKIIIPLTIALFFGVMFGTLIGSRHNKLQAETHYYNDACWVEAQ